VGTVGSGRIISTDTREHIVTIFPTFPTDAPFNDPRTSCCDRDAADCDCGLSKALHVIHERYTVEDDGSGGSETVETDTRTDVHDCAPEHGTWTDDVGIVHTWHESSARVAVGILRRENLGYGADGGNWFGWPEPVTVDYSTGEELRVTAHFHGAWTDSEQRAVLRMLAWLDARDDARAAEYAARTR
jgi:hypothetical protein